MTLSTCESGTITTRASGSTDFYLPDPVLSAYIDNSSNDCLIEWKHYAPEGEDITYEVSCSR